MIAYGVGGGAADNPLEEKLRGKLSSPKFRLNEFRKFDAAHGKFDSLEIKSPYIIGLGKAKISNVVKDSNLLYKATLSTERFEIYGLVSFAYRANSGGMTKMEKYFATWVKVDKPLELELTFESMNDDNNPDVILKGLQMSESSHQSATYTTKLPNGANGYSACNTFGDNANQGEMNTSMCQDVVDLVNSKLQEIDRFDIIP